MSMSKKDFVALADALRPVVTNEEGGEVYLTTRAAPIVDAVADFCAGQNFRFNRGRWFSYLTKDCGPSGGKIKKSKPQREG